MLGSKLRLQARLPLAILLLLFSLLGDFLSLPMLYGMRFHFSTLFLILAFILIGSPAAIIMALITACSNYVWLQMSVWDSVIVFAEILFLALACRIRKGSVFLYDLLFWFLTSAILLISTLYVDLFPSHTQLLLLLAKSSVNGSSNALMAEVLTTYLPFIRRLKIKNMSKKIPLQRILVHLSISGLIIPFVCFMIMTGISQNHVINLRALQLTQSAASSIQEQVSSWSGGNYRALELRDVIQLGELQRIVNNAASGGTQIVISNAAGDVLASSQHTDSTSSAGSQPEGRLYQYNSNLYLTLPEGRHFTELSVWSGGVYWYSISLHASVDYNINITVPASHFLNEVYGVYAIEFGLVIAFILLVLIVVYVLSKLIVQILIKLTQETTGLPDKIAAAFEMSRTESHIVEFDKLNLNFQHMALRLKEMFTEATRMNRVLTEQAKQIRQSEQEFQQLAFTDALTKIPNRLYFHKHLKQLIEERSSAVTVMFMDLNKFKNINDTYGHEIGDRLLQHVAGLLTTAAGTGNVCRLGGDEFVVVLPTADRVPVIQIAEKILELFQLPLHIEGEGLTLQPRTSIGVACYPGDTGNPDELLKLADQAMYLAKQSDSQVVWYSKEQGDV
ncbi:GGDEF domain-containing protein [Paenibacillus zeisoli]|uniref:GGDEF domain-containing protein n=1 Tax=Paenibacillus zeisoli TaxID=2496267 RepID=A0A3S1BX80_9BACL|nr:GGDEF domain-containing protein [Paenibacillus zeisoli]RUT36525.1 GGDEF domain-containing protein [Paenibacillus zeisoli]